MKEFEDLSLPWQILGYVSAAVFAVITVFICANVLARFFFNAPFSWIPEVSRHLMVWLAFLASGVALRMQAHLSLDIITNVKSKRVQVAINVAVMLAVIAFAGVTTYYGFSLMGRVARQSSSALNYSMSYPYAAIPVGSILFVFAALANIRDSVSQLRTRAEQV